MRRLLTVLCMIITSCGSGCGDRDGLASDPWESIELGTDAEFRDIFFLDSENGWIVGAGGVGVNGGIIGRTRDGGETWQYTSGLVPKRYRTSSIDLNAVHFVDEMYGTIVAESGVLLFTTNGGVRWQRPRPTGPVYVHHRDVEFVDQRHGWIVGHGGVLRTEDGGNNWVGIDKEQGVTGVALDFLDISRGWVVGKFGRVYRTNDGGEEWEKVEALGNLDGLTGDEIPSLTSVHFTDVNHGWIAGYRREMTLMEQHDHAVIIHTSDGGQTWTHQLNGVEALLTSIRFADRLRGWAIGYNGNNGVSTVLHTEDGGRTWQTQTTIYGEKLLALHVRGDHVWAVGDRVREEPQRLLRLVPSSADSLSRRN